MNETIRRTFELPKDLHDRIEKIAKQEYRSVNKQVVKLLTDIVERYEARVHPVVMSEPKK